MDKASTPSPDPFAKAACHCGSVRFGLRLRDGFGSIRRCTCSYCRMRGAIAISVRMSDLRFLAGEDTLSR